MIDESVVQRVIGTALRTGGDFAEVYQRYPQCLHGRCGEAAQLLIDPGVHYVRSPEKSKELCTRREPCIIVASGGMCEAGRVVPHLRHHLDDPRCAVVLVSYQAPHSVGARLLEKRPTVRFHGRTWNKWAEVVELNGFSGHADHDDFLDRCWHDHLTLLWNSYPYKPGTCSAGVTRFGIENGECSRFQSDGTGDPVES